MAERLVRTSYVDPTVNPPEPRQGDTGLHESRQDQEGYFEPLHRMHGSQLHGWGVASGLEVTATIGATGLLVLPGVALDARGRLIPLVVGGHAKLEQEMLVPVTGAGVALATAGRSGEHYVTIGWAETFDFTGVGSGVFNTETTPLLRLRATSAVPDDGEEIILAWVDLDGGAVTNTAVDNRRATGISVDRIELLSGFDNMDADPGTPVSVRHGRAARLRAFGGGAVSLETPQLSVRNATSSPFLTVNTATGRLGVNTTAPRATLDVDGTTVLRDNSVPPPSAAEGTLHVIGRTVLQPADPSVPQNTLDVRGFALVRGFLGIGKATPPETTLDVNGGAFIRGPVGVGRSQPLAQVHAVDQGGFESEDPQGFLNASNIPFLAHAKSDGQTAFGAVNASGRPAFAISIDHDAGTPAARGVPAFWDKFNGAWHMAFSIKNGNLAVGHKEPAARLDVLGGPTQSDIAMRVSSDKGVGIHVFSEVSGIPLIIGGRKWAAWLNGDVDLKGTLFKTNLQFKIDHPLDPAGRYLSHSAVESDEMKNVYDGEVVLDGNGVAEIVLPAWFEALNERFRYQLTPIGRPAPNLHIARELSGNRFAIAGGDPGTKVCWQVTGVRHDPYALANPLVVESDKEGEEHGRYRHPEPHGETSDRAVDYGMYRQP
ncbi:hypothetical protein [Acrocarpospora catenulata]|uniref:hypothetical protein n=1 Tax=Acrocarpospora catenulata TaxID=2836182 RepID=UPI001BD95ED0|nr:hypothetical protein [Acrocarpospora catenulata]